MINEHDRFRYIGRSSLLRNTIWEIRTFRKQMGVCVVSNAEWLIGVERNFDFDNNCSWEFIGNFGKKDNFNELYDLLNS